MQLEEADRDERVLRHDGRHAIEGDRVPKKFDKERMWARDSRDTSLAGDCFRSPLQGFAERRYFRDCSAI